MFIWPRDAKNSIAASCCAGHPSRFVHASTTLPSSRSSALPQEGHAVGVSNAGPSPFSVTQTTDYYDFGVDVDVEAPPESQVLDLTPRSS